MPFIYAAVAPSAAPGCRPQHVSGGLKRNLNTELLRTLSFYFVLNLDGSGFKALKSQGLELWGFGGLVFMFRISGFRVTVTQTFQNSLVKEYTLNCCRIPIMI